MNAPTLIVGLGGKGSDVVLRVSKMVEAELSDEQKERIGFAVFDTDVNELSGIKRDNPTVYTIQTSTKLSVGEYLDIDTHTRDTWFPVNAILNSKTLTEGAGQVRAVSRMALETAIRAGKMEDLHKAIENLYKLEGEEYQQALRVIIVSSLAGGTGSGLILPVALYIKNYLATRFRQSANITRGFFLLPEVFYSVIPGQAERNNLKSNAYATLREIDAFMMKGDATLPERYKNTVKMEFPSVSSGEYEEYNVRPFDFCFLFDAQNADGKKLNSFTQYLDHAANCIYAQSIGPMNKRSNSSEDNTIRKLVSERGRNRYAGAGTSRLIYPVNDVKRYMALKWSKECVSSVWSSFDHTFKELAKQNAEMRRKGMHVQDIKASRSYIASVEAEAAAHNPFAMAIQEACAVYDDKGATIKGYTWESYIEALRNKIEQDSSSSTTQDLDSRKDEAETAINNINNSRGGNSPETWQLFVTAYNAIVAYKNLTVKRCNETARTIGYSLFKSSNDVVNKNEKHVLESYMKSSGGDFIHPCAARYFLYKVEEGLNEQYLATKNEVTDEISYFDSFATDNFDDSETSTKETVNDLSKTKKVSLIDIISKKLSADQEDLMGNYREYIDQIDAYRVNSVLLSVLEEGLAYVRKISAAFESFFNTFDSKIERVNKEIHQIENKYKTHKGTASIYVCASKECLEAMSEKMPYTGGTIEIDSDLAAAIYSRVRNYSLLSIKSDNGQYFDELFDKDIISYFERKLMESYGPEIDIDIITAIEKEMEYEQNVVDGRLVEEHVKSVIKSAKVLAAPFIEKPIGEEKDPINSCTYNSQLIPKDDSPRAQLLLSLLKDFGGEGDDDIPKNMILFYKSFYGLRANDLSKFAPPMSSETYDRTGGEYYKAYFELISKIHPVPSKSKVITPHIDRWWHNPTIMPDLDEGNQERQLNKICAAFFWAFVAKKIDLYDFGANQKAYRILETLIDDDDDMTLTVTNGTPCDQLYEVFDAISIYPELVEGITSSVNELLEKEMEAGKTVSQNELVEFLNNFTINTLSDTNSTVTRSIFELAFLLKKSTTTEAYNERDGLRITQVAIDEAKRVLKNFSSEADFADNVAALFEKQFERLVKNLQKDNVSEKNIFQDYLFARVCEMISTTLKELGLDDNAKAIKKRCEELVKSK